MGLNDFKNFFIFISSVSMQLLMFGLLKPIEIVQLEK